MKSQDVVIGLLIATLGVSIYGLLNNEQYAKDPWHIPILVAVLISTRQA
jgi:CDP-diglyceride synthetase